MVGPAFWHITDGSPAVNGPAGGQARPGNLWRVVAGGGARAARPGAIRGRPGAGGCGHRRLASPRTPNPPPRWIAGEDGHYRIGPRRIRVVTGHILRRPVAGVGRPAVLPGRSSREHLLHPPLRRGARPHKPYVVSRTTAVHRQDPSHSDYRTVPAICRAHRDARRGHPEKPVPVKLLVLSSQARRWAPQAMTLR